MFNAKIQAERELLQLLDSIDRILVDLEYAAILKGDEATLLSAASNMFVKMRSFIKENKALGEDFLMEFLSKSFLMFDSKSMALLISDCMQNQHSKGFQFFCYVIALDFKKMQECVTDGSLVAQKYVRATLDVLMEAADEGYNAKKIAKILYYLLKNEKVRKVIMFGKMCDDYLSRKVHQYVLRYCTMLWPNVFFCAIADDGENLGLSHVVRYVHENNVRNFCILEYFGGHVSVAICSMHKKKDEAVIYGYDSVESARKNAKKVAIALREENSELKVRIFAHNVPVQGGTQDCVFFALSIVEYFQQDIAKKISYFDNCKRIKKEKMFYVCIEELSKFEDYPEELRYIIFGTAQRLGFFKRVLGDEKHNQFNQEKKPGDFWAHPGGMLFKKTNADVMQNLTLQKIKYRILYTLKCQLEKDFVDLKQFVEKLLSGGMPWQSDVIKEIFDKAEENVSYKRKRSEVSEEIVDAKRFKLV